MAKIIRHDHDILLHNKINIESNAVLGLLVTGWRSYLCDVLICLPCLLINAAWDGNHQIFHDFVSVCVCLC